MQRHRQRKTLAILISLATLSTLPQPLRAGSKEISGKLLQQAPKIDGIIHSAEWEGADRVALQPDSPASPPAGERTDSPSVSAYVGYSQDGIYIAIDSRQQHSPVHGGLDDAVGMFNASDTAEVFLRPSTKTDQYLHLGINPAGTRYDAMRFDNTYDLFWVSAASKTTTGWSAEMFVPFAGMGFRSPMEKVWSLQVCASHKAKGGRRNYRWPAGTGGFHQTANFGSIGPLRIDFSKFVDSIEMGQAGPLVIGSNPIPLRVRNKSGKATSVRLRVYEGEEGSRLCQTVDEPLRTEADGIVTPCIQVDKLKPLTVTTELLDAKGTTLSCLPSRVLTPHAKEIEILVNTPCYRNTIYCSNPVDQIDADIVLAYDRDILAGKKVKVEFGPAGTDQAVLHSLLLPAKQVTKASFGEMQHLATGDYVVTATLLDGKESRVSTSERTIHKLAPPREGNEVVFDQHHRLLVNGRLFFPLGAFMDSTGACMGNCSKAWNVVKPTGYGLTSPRSKWFRLYEKELNTAHASGRMLLIEMHHLIKNWENPEARLACKMAVDRFKSHPALLGWYLEDEVNFRSGEKRLEYEAKWRRVVEDFREWDPYHPVVNLISPNGGRGWRDYDIYAPIPDVIASDVYPVPLKRTGERISKVAVSTGRLVSAVDDRKPVWFAPQIAGWRHHREPTLDEMRCMFYGALASGARGLLAFAVEYPIWTKRDGNHDMYSTKRGTDLANQVAEEIAGNMDVLNGIDRKAECDLQEVYAVVKETPGGTFLLVVNMSYEKKQARVRAEAMREYAVAVCGKKEDGVVGGEMQSVLEPLECRVYSLREEGE